jgi:uncharacterized delta-60 repeat protein
VVPDVFSATSSRRWALRRVGACLKLPARPTNTPYASTTPFPHVRRLRGTPVGVRPGTYTFPLSVSGPGALGVGSLSGAVTVAVCVQPANAYTPPYFVSAVDPVVIAPYGVDMAIGVRAWLHPGANATVTSVTGRDGGPLPSWLAYNASAGEVQGRPAGSTSGDFLVDVRFAVNGTAADLVTLVVRVPAVSTCSPGVVPQRGVWGGGVVPPMVLGGSMVERGWAVATASNGDVVFAGETDSYGAGRLDILVVRLDGRSGGVVWARVWGGIYDDQGPSMVITSNGDVLLTGLAVTAFTTSSDLFVLRLDGSSGAVVWARSWYAAPANNLFDSGYAIAMTPSGDVVVVGSTSGAGAGSHDVLVMRLVGSTGALVWARTWGGSNDERANAVSVAANGDLVVAGYSRSYGSGALDVLALRMDSSNGSVLWARTWGGVGSDYASDLALASNGDLILVGYTTSFGAGGNDALVLRLNSSSGAVVWARAWGGGSQEEGNAVAVASNGDVVVAGTTTSFGAGGYDALLLRLNSSSGDVVWARTWGGVQDDAPRDAAITTNGDVVIVGDTFGLAQTAGNRNGFVLAIITNGSSPVFPVLSSSAPASVGLAPGAVTASAAGTVISPLGSTASLVVNTNALAETGIDVLSVLPVTVLALTPGYPQLQVGTAWYGGGIAAAYPYIALTTL